MMETSYTYYIDLIARYMYGEATPGEILELESWVRADPANATMFAEYRKMWKTIEDGRIASSTDLDHEWGMLSDKLIKQAENLHVAEPIVHPEKFSIVHRKSKVLYFTLRVAAVIVLLAIPVFFLYHFMGGPVDRQLTATTSMIEQTLPDGTIVTLNEGSTLSYPSRFEKSFRQVTLKGEAWFVVAHDKKKPFIVASGNIRIRVVGTSFFLNTKTRDNSGEIILASGIVRVYYENKPEKITMLFPGDRAEMITNGCAIIKSTNEDVNFLAWKTKRLVFNSTPLKEVIALLMKVYHTSIRLSADKLSDCRITATFDNQSLESVINVLTSTLDLQVRNTRTGIELSGHGCYQGR
jgi:ferric-dicitrate binding protein FerR (iron transport regulator)